MMPPEDRWQCSFCDDPLIDHPKPECTEAARRGHEGTYHERTGGDFDFRALGHRDPFETFVRYNLPPQGE